LFDQIIVDEDTSSDAAVVAPVHTAAVHFVALPLALIETAVCPDISALAEAIPLHELPLVVVLVGEGVPAEAVLLPVAPLTVVGVSGLHAQNPTALFPVPDPLPTIIVAVAVAVLAFALTQSVLPSALVAILVGVAHAAMAVLFVVEPRPTVHSLGSCDFA